MKKNQTNQTLLSREEIDTLMDRWMNDPAFVKKLRANPRAALKSCGIEASDDLVQSLKDVDLNSAEELQARLSKTTIPLLSSIKLSPSMTLPYMDAPQNMNLPL